MIMQLLLVTIVIFVPQTVTMFLPKQEIIDTDKVQIEIPADDLMRSEGTPNASGETAGENPFGNAPAEAASEPAK